MTDHQAVGTLRIERVFEATADRVFRAWTDPVMAARWLSPVGHAEMVADVRPGGTFSIVMVGDGRRLEHTGEYLDVDRPHLLRFTWRSPYTGPEPSVVTVELFPAPEGVRLVLTHSSLPDDAVVSHEGGWGSMLEQLGSVLTRDSR